MHGIIISYGNIDHHGRNYNVDKYTQILACYHENKQTCETHPIIAEECLGKDITKAYALQEAQKFNRLVNTLFTKHEGQELMRPNIDGKNVKPMRHNIFSDDNICMCNHTWTISTTMHKR